MLSAQAAHQNEFDRMLEEQRMRIDMDMKVVRDDMRSDIAAAAAGLAAIQEDLEDDAGGYVGDLDEDAFKE